MAEKFGPVGTENTEHGHTTLVTPAMTGRGPDRKQECETENAWRCPVI